MVKHHDNHAYSLMNHKRNDITAVVMLCMFELMNEIRNFQLLCEKNSQLQRRKLITMNLITYTFKNYRQLKTIQKLINLNIMVLLMKLGPSLSKVLKKVLKTLLNSSLYSLPVI